MKKDLLIKIIFAILLLGSIYLIVSGLISKDEVPINNTIDNNSSNEILEQDIELSTTTVNLEVGDEQQINANVVPSNATYKNLTWISSNINIATVSNGLIKGIGEGSCTIQVTTEKKKLTKIINVTVKNNEINVTKINVSNPKIELFVGEKATIDYTIEPSNATNKKINIKVDNNDIASFNAKNEIVALKDGTATITITSSNGVSATINVTVKKKINYSFTCSGTIDRYGTNVKVTGVNDSDVKKYTWNLDGKDTKGDKTYHNKTRGFKTIKVSLLFTDGTTKTKTCSVKDNLPYHFKSNEGTPLYSSGSCGKISDAENDKLNAELNKIINSVGRGTRAGVVEAGRFLMGRIPYVIAYQGRGANNIKTAGLHFGTKKNSWGCRYEGYINGMDCTGFMNWPFYTNGIKRTYSNSPTPLRGNIDKVKVGDVLLSYDYSHKAIVGIPFGHDEVIIGIDDDYIYTLSNGLTKTSIKNPPDPGTNCTNGACASSESHKNAYYRNVIYAAGDGKLTKMWIKWD